VKLGVRYDTVYRYPAPVNFSRHEIRLFPRSDVFTRVLRSKFRTNKDANVRFGRDVFDNVVAACSFSEAAPELRFQLELDLELQEKNPFDFLLTEEAVSPAIFYRPELHRVLAPFKDAEAEPVLAIPRFERPTPEKPQPTVAALASLNQRTARMHRLRAAGGRSSPRSAGNFAGGRGACRDVAVLLAAVLRQLGLAARLTSGYLARSGRNGTRAGRKVRCTPGRKFTCPVRAGWEWMRRMEFFPTTISSPPRSGSNRRT
jgi:transglutaminase-like putative cysteine protease